MSSIFNNIRTIGKIDIESSLTVSSDVRIEGDLTVIGTQTITNIATEQLLVKDAHTYINSSFIGTDPTSAGMFANIGAVTNGVSNTTFTQPATITTGSIIPGLSVGSFVQVNDAVEPVNNGVYEIVSGVGTINLVIATTPNQPFSNSGVTTSATDANTFVTHVNLSSVRANGTTGKWESASGNNISGFVAYEEFITSLGDAESHSLLTDLIASDDHTQYVHIDGRTAPQTINGGSATLGTLTLQANAADTTGQILIATTSADATTVSDGALTVSAGGLSVFKSVFVGANVTAVTSLQAPLINNSGGTLQIGESGQTTDVLGNLRINQSLSSAGPTADLFASTTTTINVGSVSATTNLLGPTLVSSRIDTTAGVALLLGDANATSVEIADVGVVTDVQGSLTVAESITTNGSIIEAPFDHTTTTVVPTNLRSTNILSFSGNKSLTIPDTLTNGTRFTFINSTVGIFTIITAGSETIESEASNAYVTEQWDRMTIQKYNTNWVIV